MADDNDPNGGFGIAFDLDDSAAPVKPAAPAPRPAPSGPGAPPGFGAPGFGAPGMPLAPIPQAQMHGGTMQGGPQPMQQRPGGLPPLGTPLPGGPLPHYGADDVPPPPDSRRFSDMAREKGMVVAKQVGEVAVNVAGHARVAAIAAAKQSIGGDEPKKVIRIEDPSTWVKPMRGPLIALGLAVTLSVLAVIVGKVSGTKLSVGWISGPLLLGAIVFAVIRWVRLQE